MSPSEYKTRYESIRVPSVIAGDHHVRVNQYVLRGVNYNATAHQQFMRYYRKNKIDVDLEIDTGSGRTIVESGRRLRDMEARINKKTKLGMSISIEQEVRDIDSPTFAGFKRVNVTMSTTNVDWGRMFSYCFVGKGTPEHFQCVLQLAHYWGLTANPQKYANEALGLDCNGFVGNYLWHAMPSGPRKPWTDLGHDVHHTGPDAVITGYFHGKKLVEDWEAMDPARSYIFGMTNDSGGIMAGGPKSIPGHIVITEPNNQSISQLTPQEIKSGQQPTKRWVVESTAAQVPGLTEGWYTGLKKVSKHVFYLHRGPMKSHQKLNFAIAAVS